MLGAAVDAASVADRLEHVDMREAARFRFDSSRAVDTARMHHEEFATERTVLAEAVRGLPDGLSEAIRGEPLGAAAAGVAAGLEGAAKITDAVPGGIACAFESLFGGASPAYTVQHIHQHHHVGHGISR